MWCGVVWCCAIRCGVVWCGVVLCDVKHAMIDAFKTQFRAANESLFDDFFAFLSLEIRGVASVLASVEQHNGPIHETQKCETQNRSKKYHKTFCLCKLQDCAEFIV